MMGKNIVMSLRVFGMVSATALLAAAGAALPQGDAARGEKRFEECASCHSVAPGENGVGPTLQGIFNRKAGSLEDFRYSPAMRNSGIVWTPETLDAFITDPQKVVPGNRMAYAGLPDAADRSDVISYLQKATK
jgi:cytochrome c2